MGFRECDKCKLYSGNNGKCRGAITRVPCVSFAQVGNVVKEKIRYYEQVTTLNDIVFKLRDCSVKDGGYKAKIKTDSNDVKYTCFVEVPKTGKEFDCYDLHTKEYVETVFIKNRDENGVFMASVVS